jgi:hypothetical protein
MEKTNRLTAATKILNEIADEINHEFGLDSRDDEIREYKDGSLGLDLRCWSVFCDRPGEEDDDHPEFFRYAAVKAIVEKTTDGTGWTGQILASEKKWFEIRVR